MYNSPSHSVSPWPPNRPAGAAAFAEQKAMTPEQIREFFAAQQRHWRERDALALAEGHSAEGTIVSPIFRTVTGMKEIVDSYRSVFETFPDWDLRADELLVDGTRAAEVFTVTATHHGEFMGIPGSGRRFTIQGVRLFTMGDGRIDYERRYYDFTGLLIQLGVIRGKPAR
jgi:steroid delta-isomerase-like uncharacterized protein